MCVKGRKKNPPHYTRLRAELVTPEVVMDYAFLRDLDEEGTVTILVARDRGTRITQAAQIPRKGTTETWSTDTVCKLIDKLGHTQVILINDQEPALEAVAKAVKARRSHPTILQNPPVGESQCNGAAENAVQQVEDQIRCMKIGLEQ